MQLKRALCVFVISFVFKFKFLERSSHLNSPCTFISPPPHCSLTAITVDEDFQWLFRRHPPPLLCLHDWIYSPLLWKGPRGSKAITVVKHSCQWNIVFHRGEPMVFRITRQRSLENKKTNNLAWKAFLKSTKLLILSTLPRTLLGVMDAKAWRVSFWVIYCQTPA